MVSFEKIKELTLGAVRIWEGEDGFIHFSRFTEKQAKLIVERDFAPHDRATASIKIEFMTCGGEISFEYTAIKATESDCFNIEITQNGVPVHHVYTEGTSSEAGELKYIVPQSAIPVPTAIYFPNLAGMQIKNLILPDDAAPVKKSMKILALGDSITHGEWANHANHTYINMVANELNAEVVNQGVRGDNFFADNIDEDLPFDPDIVTVAYGVNDYACGELFTENPGKYLEKLYGLYSTKKIFVILPIWYSKENAVLKGHTLEEGRMYIKELAEKYPNMTVINCANVVPHLPEFYHDEIMLHPNDLGYFYYGTHVSKALKKELGIL